MPSPDGASCGVPTHPGPQARLRTIILLCALSSLSICCDNSVTRERIHPAYDQKTGKLRQLTYDSDHNGKTDTWSYMDGSRVLRIEIDKNEDGRIDRWEYYSNDQRLEKIGISRSNDGKVDSWLFSGADGTIARIELSLMRDGRVDRTEYYEAGVLTRAEQDTDGDGRVDKWETYDGRGALANVAFDTKKRGVPDRRLVYRDDGSLDRVETDVAPESAEPVLPKQ